MNGVVESFDNIMKTALTKVCNSRRDNRDQKVSAVLWAYRTTCKKLTGQTPFRLVYGKEVVMPMEYIVPSLRVLVIIEMTDVYFFKGRLLQLIHLEEERFIARFHQNVEKQRQKVWHDRHIKSKNFEVGGLVLIYNSKFFNHMGKLKTHWLGPYVIKEIIDGGAVKLENLNGTEVRGPVNGSRMKPYFDNCDSVT